jgi:hypothetical protein
VFTAALASGVWSGSSAPEAVLTGATDTISLTGALTPPAIVATHVINMSVTSSATDAVPADNSILAAASVSVNNYIYARDKGTATNGTYNAGDGFEAGNVFDIFAPANLSGIDAYIDAGAVVGAEVYAKLYSVDPTATTTAAAFVFVDESAPYILTAADLGQKITLALSAGAAPLSAGVSYVVVLGSYGDGGASDDLIISTAGVSEASTSYFYDMTDNTWYYTTSTPMVRMNFDPSLLSPTSALLSGTATICAGSSTNLSVAVTGGVPPYTVTVTNGTNNYTATGSSPVSIPVSPAITSTYTIVSVTGGGGTGTGNSGAATVTITPSSTNTTTITACNSYVWNGTTYSTSGVYTGTTTNCVTQALNLTITPSSTNTTTASACNSYVWNGTTYTTSGVYTGPTTNCVTETLDLTITPSSTNTTTASACNSYVWNGTTYTQSGVYTGPTANCVTESLNLTITPSSTITQPTSQSINISNNAQFIVGSSGSNAIYQWQTNLGFGFQNLNNAGQYNGTTSSTLSVLNLSMSNNNQVFRCIISSGSCTDTSDVAVLTVVNNAGINDLSASKLSIYPNPTNGDFTITGLELVGTISSLNLTDMNGKVVKVLDTKATKFSMGSIKPGVYFLNILSGSKQEVLKIVKE